MGCGCDNNVNDDDSGKHLFILFLFYFICHYLTVRLFYKKLQELIQEIEINGEET